jgi:hypothetical protein
MIFQIPDFVIRDIDGIEWKDLEGICRNAKVINSGYISEDYCIRH